MQLHLLLHLHLPLLVGLISVIPIYWFWIFHWYYACKVIQKPPYTLAWGLNIPKLLCTDLWHIYTPITPIMQAMCEVLKLNNENNVALATLYQTQHHFNNTNLTNNIISAIPWGKKTLLKLHYTKQHPHEYLWVWLGSAMEEQIAGATLSEIALLPWYSSEIVLPMPRDFHYLAWTLHTSPVSIVLLEHKWCCATKSVYNSSGILSPQVKVWGRLLNSLTFKQLNVEHSSSECSFKAPHHIQAAHIDIQALANLTQ